MRVVGVSITGIRSSPPGMPGWMRAGSGLGAPGKLWQSPSATCSVLISCRSCAWQSRLSSYLPRCSGFGGPDHHPPNPGQPVAGVVQIGRAGSAAGPPRAGVGRSVRRPVAGPDHWQGWASAGPGWGPAAGFPQADRWGRRGRRSGGQQGPGAAVTNSCSGWH